MDAAAPKKPVKNDQLDLPKPLKDLPLPEKELPPPSDEEKKPEVEEIEHEEEESTPPQYRSEEIEKPLPKQQLPREEMAYAQDEYQQPFIKTLLSWQGLGRPFRQHSREYYINVSLIVMIIEVILFLFSQYVLMLVVISLLFVVIALAVVPPHTVEYRISTEGIAIDDYFYLWQELYDFYFKHVNGEDILHIRTRDEASADISILLGDIPKDYIRSLLLNYLPYRETVPLTFMERSGDWLSRTFPLDKMPSQTS